ncbi:MAG TPA: transporter [Allosphingosinicella sp.]|nr:transporter [Allosphingosinicella sp.]
MKVAYLIPALFLAAPALAQEAPPAEIPALCTDRPTKSNFACTVPQGMVQIETDLFSLTRTEAGGARADLYLYTNPTLKYGLTDQSDLELNIAPLVELRTRVGAIRTSQTSIGDLYLRYKHRFTNPASRVQVAAIPYVKVPLAERGIGNREWEGGLIVPVNISLAPVTLTVVPSLDVLADALDPGDRHVQLTGLVNVGVPLSPQVTLYGELWTAQNFDPAGTVRQYSADAAITWLVSPNLQLDVGGNFGLNQATPDVQLYAGLSTRF